VVIHVGDNGLIGADELRRTLAALHGARRVIVFNLHVHRPWEAPNNRTIARVAPAYGNVRVLDWHSVAGRHHDWLYDDQIHLTKRGAAGYARLLVSAAREP
jgi:N-formylglutamate amidohydrolase